MSQSSEIPSASASASADFNLPDPDLMLNHAITYIDRGWRVFPLHSITPFGQCTCRSSVCQQKGNHPIRPAGIRGATTRLRDILEWWEDDPDANIGIVTGAGLLVIAVYPERRGSLNAVPINPIPQTGLVKVGNAGWHLYFTYKKNVLVYSQQDVLGPGIDLIAEGGYVVAPPGLHHLGQRYTWTTHIAPRTLPPKVLTLLQPEQGWSRSDYLSVLDLMHRGGYPLTPTEIAHGLHKDYSATLKLLRHMISDHQIYLVRRGLYAPGAADTSHLLAPLKANDKT